MLVPAQRSMVRAGATTGWLALALAAALLVMLVGQVALDQPPPASPPPSPTALADYNPSDLNGGSRGFPPQDLTANYALY
ncbi:MAG TPA: hypothetical protein VF157_03745 [Chloroflexota bacterium]